jgi:hypothetical protein
MNDHTDNEPAWEEPEDLPEVNFAINGLFLLPSVLTYRGTGHWPFSFLDTLFCETRPRHRSSSRTVNRPLLAVLSLHQTTLTE